MQTHGDTPADIDDLIRFGTIAAVANKRITVRCGDIVSPPLQWITLAGPWSFWCPPSTGEQVTLLCPSGDIAGAVALRGLTSDHFPDGPDGLTAILTAPDAATFSYDPEAHALAITLAGGGTLTLNAPGGSTLNGDVTVNGRLHATQDISTDAGVTASGEVTGKGIHLSTHTHGGVRAGSDHSGAPE